MSTSGNDDDLIKVVVRVRKLINRERNENKVFTVQDSQEVVQKDTDKTWRFDRVYSQVDDNQAVYQGTAQNIIESAVQGYNSTIFAYGQTSSGKTHTMMGTDDEPGIIPLAVDHLFYAIDESPDREFLMQVSYLEIYNETILDLLCEPSKRKQSNLRIREKETGNVFVEGLEEAVVSSPEEVINLMRMGEKNRHYGETNMNARSSRSHTIFRIIVESKLRSDNEDDDGSVIMVSHLNLVDLAGSEKAGQTGAKGAMLKEGCNINGSLMILGQVIQKLSSASPGFVNFRDSKLTRILQNSLGGNARTAIIATVTPAAMSVDQTISTLRFAHTAKTIQQHAEVNEVMDDQARINRMKSEMEALQKKLEEQIMMNGSELANKQTIQEMQEKLEQEKQEKEALIYKIAELQELQAKIVVSSQPPTFNSPAKQRPPGMRKSMRQSFMFRPPPSPMRQPIYEKTPSPLSLAVPPISHAVPPIRLVVDDETCNNGATQTAQLQLKVEELEVELSEAKNVIKEKQVNSKALAAKVEELQNKLRLTEEKSKEERIKMEIDLKQKHKTEISSLTNKIRDEIEHNMPAVEEQIKLVVEEKNDELKDLCDQYKTQLENIQLGKKGVCYICKRKFKGENGVKNHLRLSLCGDRSVSPMRLSPSEDTETTVGSDLSVLHLSPAAF